VTALTAPETRTWLQVHESELLKMRNLFARKGPCAPDVICYADATFRQIASFAQLNVLELKSEERTSGIRMSRKLSAASSVKKKAGSETRAQITRLLELHQLSRTTKWGHLLDDAPDADAEAKTDADADADADSKSSGNDADKKSSKSASNSRSGSPVPAGHPADAAQDAAEEKERSRPGSPVSDKTAADVPVLTPAPTPVLTPAASSVPTPAAAAAEETAGRRGTSWFGFGKKVLETPVSKPAEVQPASTGAPAADAAAALVTPQNPGAASNSSHTQEEEDWSSDEDWDAVKEKLQVRERQDRFYIYTNSLGLPGEFAENGNRISFAGVPPLNMALSGKSGRASTILSSQHQATSEPTSPLTSPRRLNGSGDGSNGKVIINCLDVSLNRFRFLDFAEASRNINWSVRHIVAMNLSGNLLVSLEGIAACMHLRVLSCNDNLLTSMTPLKGCKFLRRLKISGNRLTSLSLLSEQDMCDYYQKFAKTEGDIDINDFDDNVPEQEDEEYDFDEDDGDSDYVNIIDDMVKGAASSRLASDYFAANNRTEDVNGAASPKPYNAVAASDKKSSVKFSDNNSKGFTLNMVDMDSPADMAESKDGGRSPGANKSPHKSFARKKFSLNAMGLPELEYLDASDNALETIEGIRLYSRNSLVYLELRNCGILSHQLCHLRGLPLVTLRLDDNQLDNLRHTVTVLQTVVTVEHLSLLGNPIAGNEDKGMQPGADGSPKSNFGNNLRIDDLFHLQSIVARVREVVHKRHAEHVPSVAAVLELARSGGSAPSPKSKGSAPVNMNFMNLIGKKSTPVDEINKEKETIKDKDNEKKKEKEKEKKDFAESAKKRSYYSITVLDHVDTLKTFDHLPVPATMYSHLRSLKAQVRGEAMLLDIERHFTAEIASIEHVHANLALRHRQNEDLVKQVVREKAEGLEGEMETLLRFAREKLAEIAPDAMRKIFESRFSNEQGESVEGVAGSNGTTAPAEGEADAKEADAKANEEWFAEQLERQKALPAKNLKLISDEFDKHKVRMDAEKAEAAEQDRIREAHKQSALSKGNTSIL